MPGRTADVWDAPSRPPCMPTKSTNCTAPVSASLKSPDDSASVVPRYAASLQLSPSRNSPSFCITQRCRKLTLCRYPSEIRTGCANERPSGSVRGVPGRLVSLPRSGRGWLRFAVHAVDECFPERQRKLEVFSDDGLATVGQISAEDMLD